MASLLGLIGGTSADPPAMLGAAADPSFLNRLGSALGNNSNALMGASAALLGGRGFGGGMEAFQKGQLYDRYHAKEAKDEKKRSAKEAQWATYVDSMDASDAEKAALKANPELADDALKLKFFTKTDGTELSKNIEAAGFKRGSPEFQAAMRYQLNKGTIEKPTEKQREVEAYVGRGMSRQQAEDLAYGNMKTVPDPVTGQTRVLNIAGGGADAAGAGGFPPPPPPPASLLGRPAETGRERAEQQLPPETRAANRGEQSLGLYETIAEPGVAGWPGAAGEAWTKIAPQIPYAGFKGYPEQTEKRSRYAAAQGEFLRSMATNPNYPVREMERLREEVGIQPDMFTSAEAMQARYRGIDKTLRNRLVNEQRTANDPMMPVEARKNSLQAARAIENYLGVMGVPQDEEGADKGRSKESQNGDRKAAPQGSSGVRQARDPKTGEAIEKRDGRWVKPSTGEVWNGREWVKP